MSWLLLIYRIPREPTAGRVYVWRKLKRLGAISMQDAVWVLPATPRTREHFQWLASEIAELQGEVSLFESEVLFASGGSSLREKFEAPVRAAYQEILAELKRRRPDLAALAKKYRETQEHDYFPGELAEQVRRKLLATSGGDT
jgi:hypothetical protein